MTAEERADLLAAEEALTTEEQLYEAHEFMRDFCGWLEMCLKEGSIRRKAQAEEYVEVIKGILAGKQSRYLLARIDVLQRAAATLHRLDSEYGVVSTLLQAASVIALSRAILDRSGFDEWNLVTSFDNPPTAGERLSPELLAEWRKNLAEEIGQHPGESNTEYGERVGLLVKGWDLLP